MYKVTKDKVQSTKALRDGRVLIERNGETYNIEGKKL